jgi:hypothetical protein
MDAWGARVGVRGDSPLEQRLEVDEFIRLQLAGREQPEGSLYKWARRELPDLLTATRTITLPGDRHPIRHPLSLLLDPFRTGGRKIDALLGFVHGDLHPANILVQVTPRLEAADYRLVDLSSFSTNGALAAESAYLQLGIVARRLRHLSGQDRSGLIGLLVDPTGPEADVLPVWLSRVIGGIQTAAAAEPADRGLEQEWRQQAVLAMLAAALIFAGRRTTPDEHRLWYVRLAAHAASAYLSEDAPAGTAERRYSAPALSRDGSDVRSDTSTLPSGSMPEHVTNAAGHAPVADPVPAITISKDRPGRHWHLFTLTRNDDHPKARTGVLLGAAVLLLICLTGVIAFRTTRGDEEHASDTGPTAAAMPCPAAPDTGSLAHLAIQEIVPLPATARGDRAGQRIRVCGWSPVGHQCFRVDVEIPAGLYPKNPTVCANAQGYLEASFEERGTGRLINVVLLRTDPHTSTAEQAFIARCQLDVCPTPLPRPTLDDYVAVLTVDLTKSSPQMDGALIYTPTSGTYVDRCDTVAGLLNRSGDSRYWLLIYSQANDTYYLSRPVVENADSWAWEIRTVNIGGAQDGDRNFTLLVVRTSGQLSVSYQDLLGRARAGAPRLDGSLATGAAVLAQVDVRRSLSSNC